MGRLRFMFQIMVMVLSVFGLNACGDDEADTTQQEPTRALEVVVFATQTSATATPIPPSATPSPASEAAKALPTATPVVQTEVRATSSPTLTPTSGITRAENENPLTGLQVENPAVLKRRPLHVRIGNDPQARPQVNLSQADLVYEEIVEWWITRLTAVYYGQAPEVVGPIRSARLINGQLTQQYDAALINSGGSDGVRWELSQLPLINLDEYFHPRPYFYREGEPWQRRLAVNIALAYDYMDKQGLQAPVSMRGFAFDSTPVSGNLAETIFVDYPAKESKVLWRFNDDTGQYERYTAGEPFVDNATNEIIAVPNVIIYFAEHEKTDIVEDSTGATSVRIKMNGEGTAWIFRDRTLLEGRWRTDGTQTPEFFNFEGKPIPLRPGPSWIQVVPTDYEILVNQTP